MSQASDRPVRVVFLDRDTISPETVLRALSFPHELEVFDRTTAEQVADRIVDADIVITNKAPVREAALEGATRLRLVAVAATGTDMVDVKAANARGVTVCNIRNYAVNTVPEHTFALLLALRRSILPYRESVARGRWREAAQFCYFDYPIRDLAGSTLGVIGDGALGKSVAKLGEAFGMRVLFSDYKGTTGMGPLYTPFWDVLRLSDVITLHTPLLPSTRNLIGAPEFAAMERKPLLINTARGGLVDEAALVAGFADRPDRRRRLRRGDHRAAARRPPAGTAAGAAQLHPHPHVAWASQEAIQGLADQLIDNVEAFWAGSPRNVVVPA